MSTIPTPEQLADLRSKRADAAYLQRFVAQAMAAAAGPEIAVTLPAGVADEQVASLVTGLQRSGWSVTQAPAVPGVAGPTLHLAPAPARARGPSTAQDPPWVLVARGAPDPEEAARRLGLTTQELETRLAAIGLDKGAIGEGSKAART